MDKELIASERQVSLGHFQLLYSAPEAILGTDNLWRQFLVCPPLSVNVVAVAVDEAHYLQVVSSLSKNKKQFNVSTMQEQRLSPFIRCTERPKGFYATWCSNVCNYCYSNCENEGVHH